MLEDSAELKQLLEMLEEKGRAQSPKNLYVDCRCLLNSHNGKSHVLKHHKSFKTPKKYYKIEAFKSYTLNNGHYKKVDGKTFFYKVNEKPDDYLQTKLNKKALTRTEK